MVHPNILLMDEPFSALDVLTAENLRTDFLDLWAEGQLPIKGVHPRHAQYRGGGADVRPPAAVLRPIPAASSARSRSICRKPRDRLDPRFRALVDRIYVEMTARPRGAGAPRRRAFPRPGIGTLLPHVSSNLLSGLIEAVAAPPYNGKADLPEIASDLQMEIDELFPVAEALQMLRFAESTAATSGSPRWASTSPMPSRRAQAASSRAHLLSYVPLAAHIRRVLDERASHTRARKSRFIDELEDHMTEDAAEETLRAMISWARYAELFAYDDDTGTFRKSVVSVNG